MIIGPLLKFHGTRDILRRQARDRLATSDRDRRPVDGQDRYPALDARPETPKNLDIALHRPGIPVHQPPRSTHAADRWSTNTQPTTPISDSQTSLQGSRTQNIWVRLSWRDVRQRLRLSCRRNGFRALGAVPG